MIHGTNWGSSSFAAATAAAATRLAPTTPANTFAVVLSVSSVPVNVSEDEDMFPTAAPVASE